MSKSTRNRHRIPSTAGRNNKAGRKPKLNMDQLLARIVSLMARHHPRDLSFSMVARLCEVPRSTLYYYFGSDRQNMLKEAAQFSMKTFVQLYSMDQDISAKDWKEFEEKRFSAAMEVVKNFPWAPSVYFRYRNDLGEMGSIVRDIESQYLNKYAQAYQKFHQQAPHPKAIRFMAYLKLGVLYGFSVEREVWLGKDLNQPAAYQQLLKKFNDLIEDALNTPFN